MATGEPSGAQTGEGRKDNPEDEDREVVNKVLGCIPHHISGQCPCCLSCMSYYINPVVMTLAILIIWSFVIWCAVDENAGASMADAQVFVVDYFGWFYVTALVIFGSFAIYLCFSKFGDIKLGPEDEPPKYSLMTWFSMLFSAGIGTGLYFFGVAEPVWHFAAMQSGSSRWYHLTDNQQAMEALNITWFHWGFTASATYVVAALPLAYHHHVHNEPLRESSCFIVLIGEKYADGIIGCIIDLTSTVSTMFGVSTSLGLGVLSISAGLNYIFDVPKNLTTYMIIIWVITLLATISVLSGLDKGIRRLSELNFAFSFLCLFFMFFALDAFFMLDLFIQGIGYHLQWILELTFNTQAFERAGFYDIDDGASDQSGWFRGWTIFYWAWWIAWAPFVGIFLAQISRGRTIREFIMGNMMVPTLMTCIWLTIFGGIGLYNELASAQNGIECTDNQDDWYSEFDGNKVMRLSCVATSEEMLFAAISTLPLAKFISTLAMIGLITYFVTSSDSASHIIDILTAGGNTEPPKAQRVFWAISEGAVASVLLAAGGGEGDRLAALQTASLVAALPFTVVLIFETYATYITLLHHVGEIDLAKQTQWRFDLFESTTKFPEVFLALVCPPYYQTKTRLAIIRHKQGRLAQHGGSDEMRKFLENVGFDDDSSKYMFIAGYWFFYGLAILFMLLEYAQTGWLWFGCVFYLFYLIVSIGNRAQIKGFYFIDSTAMFQDCCSWVFCWCCAAIQEQGQGLQDVDLNVKLNQMLENKKKKPQYLVPASASNLHSQKEVELATVAPDVTSS